MRAVVRSGLVAACAVALLSCKGEVTAPLTGVQRYIAKVALASGTVTATLVRGDAPAAGAGATPSATVPPQAINGGSSEVALTSADQFTVVIIAVDGQTDYYRLTLSAPATAADLVITLAQQIPSGSFDLVLGVGASPTAIGPYVSQTLALVTVGTGDVQVSVSWNTAADVDLHVVDPSSEEIFYGDDIAASGGELDLDSNAACGTDGPRNENITWADGTAPSGTYIVRLDYWSNCGAASTNYVVTVHVTGQATQTFTGSFTGSGDGGGLGDGIQITTFTK